jgi:hypothetical protein
MVVENRVTGMDASLVCEGRHSAAIGVPSEKLAVFRDLRDMSFPFASLSISPGRGRKAVDAFATHILSRAIFRWPD